MSQSRYNAKLFNLVMSTLSEKMAFTPMPPGDPNAAAAGGGAPPPGADPMAAVGAPPVGGAPQMDPTMMAAMQQGMAPDVLPANSPEPEEEGKDEKGPGDVQDQIRTVLTEAGIIKPPKLKPEEQFVWMRAAIHKICDKLGIDAPPLPDPSNMSMNGQSGGGSKNIPAMTSGMGGGPSDQALGSMSQQPLDPSQGAMPKQANISTKSASIREALKRLRK